MIFLLLLVLIQLNFPIRFLDNVILALIFLPLTLLIPVTAILAPLSVFFFGYNPPIPKTRKIIKNKIKHNSS